MNHQKLTYQLSIECDDELPSAGGEGSLISAAGSVWGIGSDIGGSIRYTNNLLKYI